MTSTTRAIAASVQLHSVTSNVLRARVPPFSQETSAMNYILSSQPHQLLYTISLKNAVKAVFSPIPSPFQ